MKKLMIALVALFLVGCGQATNDVSQLEPETVDQEEVQETEETEEETETDEEDEEEPSQPETADSTSPESANAPTETQPADVQTESASVQSQPVQETAQEAPAVAPEEDLAYDGDLGDADLYPNQPMFIDGVLYSGDTSGVPADMIITAGDLRVLGYTVYELTVEEYDQLMQDVNNGVIPYEEVMSHYLNNY